MVLSNLDLHFGRLCVEHGGSLLAGLRPRLVVEPQQVVPGQPDSADGRPGLETGVWPVPIVAVYPGRQMRGALGGGVVDVGIGPLAQGGLMKRSALPLVRGVKGARVSMAEASREAACGEGTGAVTPAVVGQHAADLDAEMLVVGERGGEKRGGAGGRLVGVDLGEGHAGMVIHADMDVFPAGALDLVWRRSWVTRWPARRNRPSFLISRCSRSPGCGCS